MGDRVREERERLGLSQTAFGAVGGASKRTQIGWEGGRSSPTLDAIVAWAKIGVDVQYLATGMRSAAALTRDEEALLVHFRAAPNSVRTFIFNAFEERLVLNSKGPLATFGGENKGVVTENLTIHGGFNPSKK